MLGEGVLKFAACLVVVDGDVPDGSSIEVFFYYIAAIYSLRALPKSAALSAMVITHFCVAGILHTRPSWRS